MELTCLWGWGLGAGSTQHHAGPQKEAPLFLRKQREKGTCGENLYHGFHRKETVSRLSSRALGTQEITEAGSMGQRVRWELVFNDCIE